MSLIGVTLRPVAQPFLFEAMTLRELCTAHGSTLSGLIRHDGAMVDGGALLYAITGRESSFGRDREFVRDEPAYRPGGMYFKAKHVTAAWKRYGVLASSSFGSWQLLYIVAAEMGFAGHPIDLQQDAVSVRWVEKLIRVRLIGHQGAQTLAEVCRGYNGGNIHSQAVKPDYWLTVSRHYRDAVGA